MIQDIPKVRISETLERAQNLAAPEKRNKDLEKVAHSFESIFVQMMTSAMRKTVKKSELFSGGRGEEIFTGLLDRAIAEESTQRGGGLGIAEMIIRQYSGHVRAAEGPIGKMAAETGKLEFPGDLGPSAMRTRTAVDVGA